MWYTGKNGGFCLKLSTWRAFFKIERFGIEHPYTKLVVHLDNVDPDDAFSTVPYEKGHTLLFYLEQKLGGNGFNLQKTNLTFFD